MSVKISYSNRHSVNGKAINDIHIGIDNRIVGSNANSMQNLAPGTLVVITDSSKRILQISEVTAIASDSDASVWYLRGGKKWEYNYKIIPLTLVVKITPYLKYIIDELTRGNSSEFWDNNLHHTHGGYRKIVKQLVEEINGE
jgi:hypothetical protein